MWQFIRKQYIVWCKLKVWYKCSYLRIGRKIWNNQIYFMGKINGCCGESKVLWNDDEQLLFSLNSWNNFRLSISKFKEINNITWCKEIRFTEIFCACFLLLNKRNFISKRKVQCWWSLTIKKCKNYWRNTYLLSCLERWYNYRCFSFWSII